MPVPQPLPHHVNGPLKIENKHNCAVLLLVKCIGILCKLPNCRHNQIQCWQILVIQYAKCYFGLWTVKNKKSQSLVFLHTFLSCISVQIMFCFFANARPLSLYFAHLGMMMGIMVLIHTCDLYLMKIMIMAMYVFTSECVSGERDTSGNQILCTKIWPCGREFKCDPSLLVRALKSVIKGSIFIQI